MATMSAAYMRDYRAKRAASGDGGLLPFQQAYTDAVCRVNNPPEIAALSVPRGNGKSWLCGGLVARSLTPDDPLFEPGVENILVSSSTNQARIVLEFARAALGEAEGYRWRNAGALYALKRAGRAFGSFQVTHGGPWALARTCGSLCADEPGAWSPFPRPSIMGRHGHELGQAPRRRFLSWERLRPRF